MLKFIATIHVLGLTLRERVNTARSDEREDGITTVELVIYASGAAILALFVWGVYNTWVRAHMTGIS
jgi:hypothetical protein